MRTTTLTLTLLAVLALPALLPAQADARYTTRIGIGDQQVSMFANPSYRALKIRRVRYFIPWNAMRNTQQRLAARQYVLTARRSGASVFMHISSDNLTRRKARLPKLATYRRDVTRLVKYFRKLGVREWGSRNEANHDSQATYRSPKRAADEFKIVRRACRGCTVVGLDVLDQAGATRYMQRFYRALGSYRRYARIVGIHNYSDVNRRRTRGTTAIIRMAKRYNRRSTFWLTETGGVVSFGSSFPYSPSRAASRLKYLFTTTARLRRDIDRVYIYNWTGANRGARFDAGVTNPDGTPRPAYGVLRSRIKRFSR